jgi:hypothetical protein
MKLYLPEVYLLHIHDLELICKIHVVDDKHESRSEWEQSVRVVAHLLPGPFV